MGSNQKEPWVNYLEGDVLNKEGPAGHRVYQLVIRVRAEGLQAVIKARRGEEYFVEFVGAGTLTSLAGRVRDKVAGPDTRWREDKYAPI